MVMPSSISQANWQTRVDFGIWSDQLLESILLTCTSNWILWTTFSETILFHFCIVCTHLYRNVWSATNVIFWILSVAFYPKCTLCRIIDSRIMSPWAWSLLRKPCVIWLFALERVTRNPWYLLLSKFVVFLLAKAHLFDYLGSLLC